MASTGSPDSAKMDVEAATGPSEGAAPPPTVSYTIGGYTAHVLRRLYHVSMFIVLPIIYYWYGDSIADALKTRRERILSVAFVIICVVEAVRLHFRWTCFGLRSYEATNLSAQFWGTVGCIIVFLVAPSRGPSKEEQGYLGIPIVWSLGIVDPLMGELKYHKVELRRRVAIGVVCAAIVWAVAAAWLARDSVFAWIMVVVMAPITVAAEAPKVPSLDDNGLMLLIPLAVAVALHPWAD